LIEIVKSGVVAEVGGGVDAGGVVAVGATCDVVPPPQAVANCAMAIRKDKTSLVTVVGAWAFGAQRAAPLQMLGDGDGSR
jgi:hypothetical protein